VVPVVRVIAGTLKGRTLEAPDWDGLRPTSDRLRETLFNVLAPRIEGARVLDAYAGTGAVGIEALSRGASHVTFIEQDRRAQRLIETNLGRCRIENRYAIIRVGFAGAARQLTGPFDLLFLDPPYGADTLQEALEIAAPLVGPGALLVIEHARRDESPESVSGITRVRKLESGDSALSFYRRAAHAADTDD
jgi:16S rRNA (guanine(966)-N(2))-methyltransferase RsmD